MATHEAKPYCPKDAIALMTEGVLVAGGAGLAMSAIRNALQKEHVGFWGVVTRSGGIIGHFAATGGAYAFSTAVASNLRGKDDHWNEGIGGFLGGAVYGLRSERGRLSSVIGCGAFMGISLLIFDYAGASLRGYGHNPEEDEFERKERMRKNRRRPIEETIAELGEGRCIHPPGYEERRRQRLKEKYGVDINPVSADPDA